MNIKISEGRDAKLQRTHFENIYLSTLDMQEEGNMHVLLQMNFSECNFVDLL
jgi:hypothetical protein